MKTYTALTIGFNNEFLEPIIFPDSDPAEHFFNELHTVFKDRGVKVEGKISEVLLLEGSEDVQEFKKLAGLDFIQRILDLKDGK